MRDIVSIVITVILIIVGLIGGLAGQDNILPGSTSSLSASKSLPTQQQIANETNAFRDRNDQPSIIVDPHLNQVAQNWADQLAREDRMYHNPDYSAQYRPG